MSTGARLSPAEGARIKRGQKQEIATASVFLTVSPELDPASASVDGSEATTTRPARGKQPMQEKRTRTPPAKCPTFIKTGRGIDLKTQRQNAPLSDLLWNPPSAGESPRRPAHEARDLKGSRRLQRRSAPRGPPKLRTVPRPGEGEQPRRASHPEHSQAARWKCTLKGGVCLNERKR